MANRCGDCDFLNYKDTKWGGDKVWCNYKGYYVKPGEVACDNYTYKGHRFGRYLITATCKILNIDNEKCKKLYDAFDIVRDEKTPETENMYDMIKGYDIVGPQIATKLFNDSFKEEIAYSMLNDYILPCLTLVQNGSYLEAVNLYDNMTMTLYNFYFKKEDNLPLTRKKD